MDYSQYDVAVFAGNECRGIAEVLSLGNDKECLYLRARSNQESGETLSFKYYNRATEEILPIYEETINFVANSRVGYPSSPKAITIYRYYNVTLTAGDGGSLDKESGAMKEGSTLTVTATPDEGHSFVQWSDGETDNPRSITITEDLDLSAEFKVNSYNLTYKVDGIEYKSSPVEYGTKITPEAYPTKEGYTFSGWEGLPETMPAKDVTATGSFSINTYTAYFKIGEEFSDSVAVVFGQPITAPEAPDKEGHTFDGWQDVPATMPAHDIEILGSYTVNKYNLVYTVDGTEYKKYSVEYGTSITPEAYPTKEGYTFSGWTGLPETMPAKDVTAIGSFSINTYTAYFKIGEEFSDSVAVVFGQPITAPEAPAKEGHTFDGWQDVPATMPDHDIEILGSYTVNKYNLVYKVDGEAYKSYSIDFGTAITPEEEPTKDGYTFSGWGNVPETMPANDVTVSGTFSINSYTLTIYLNDEIYYSESIEYGAPIEIADPEIPEGMQFDGWQEEIPQTMPAHDLDIHGTYSAKSYLESIFSNDNNIVTICTISGQILYKNATLTEVIDRLENGIYIINGKKILIRK